MKILEREKNGANFHVSRLDWGFMGVREKVKKLYHLECELKLLNLYTHNMHLSIETSGNTIELL